MLKIGKDNTTGKNVLFGYYFLPGPNYKTSIKCNHVAESIMQIGKANSRAVGQNRGKNDDVGGSEDVRKQLECVYSDVSPKRPFKEICPNFQTFLKMVAGAKFILAIGRELSSAIEIPSLQNEKVMATKITVEDIVDILNRMIDLNDRDVMKMLIETATTTNLTFNKDSCSQLAESIHQLLEQHELVNGTRNSITSGKLLSQNKNSFVLTNSSKVNEFLYEKIIYKYQPRVCTVLSKLAFIDLLKEIGKLNLNRSFNLLEIPYNDL